MPLVLAMILVSLHAVADEVPRAAWIDAEFVELLDEPDDAAFSTGRLRRGQKVTIRRDGPPGWCTLDPPRGSFSYIDQADIADSTDSESTVTAKFAGVRPGRDGARLPGPQRVSLREGTRVRLLDRRPLVLRRPDGVQTWVAIACPRAEVRFVRSEALTQLPPGEPESRGEEPRQDAPRPEGLERPSVLGKVRPRPRTSLSSVEVDRRFVSVVSEAYPSELSADLQAAAAKVTSEHRRILRLPIDQWDLSAVEERYRSLVRGASPGDQRALEGRIAQVKRQQSAAHAARQMESLISSSRMRDRQIAELKRPSGSSRDASATYDATGRLQVTSRTVDGSRVHALLGDDGGVVAYLMIPPGLPAKEFLSRQVGVRGDGRFDEGLKTRLIRVRDLDALPDRDRGRVILSY